MLHDPQKTMNSVITYVEQVKYINPHRHQKVTTDGYRKIEH